MLGGVILGWVKKGGKLKVLGKSQDEAWLCVCCYQNMEGWISSKWVVVPVPLEDIEVIQ